MVLISTQLPHDIVSAVTKSGLVAFNKKERKPPLILLSLVADGNVPSKRQRQSYRVAPIDINDHNNETNKIHLIGFHHFFKEILVSSHLFIFLSNAKEETRSTYFKGEKSTGQEAPKKDGGGGGCRDVKSLFTFSFSISS